MQKRAVVTKIAKEAAKLCGVRGHDHICKYDEFIDVGVNIILRDDMTHDVCTGGSGPSMRGTIVRRR